MRTGFLYSAPQKRARKNLQKTYKNLHVLPKYNNMGISLPQCGLQTSTTIRSPALPHDELATQLVMNRLPIAIRSKALTAKSR